MAEGKESSIMETLKIAAAVVGAIGSVTGVFAIIGYVILLAFANETGIYGRTSFTQQLPFESLFSAVFDWIKLCGKDSSHLSGLIGSSSVIFFIAIGKSLFKRGNAKKVNGNTSFYILTVLGLFETVLIIVTMGRYDIRQADSGFGADYLYIASIPLLIGFTMVLFSGFSAAFPRKGSLREENKKVSPTLYRAAAGVFAMVLLLTPFLYGTVFYDLPLNRMRAPIFSDSLLNNKVGALFPNEFTSSYFGNAADQCLFLTGDQSNNGWRVMMVAKSQLLSIELLRGNAKECNGLRDFYRNGVTQVQEIGKRKRDTASEADQDLTNLINK